MKMNNQNDIYDTYEIDVKKIFLSLWRSKIYVLFCSVLSVFLASYHLQNVERKFTVEYKLKPVVANEKPSVGGFGGLASLAGIDVSTSSNDFVIFQELITSVESAEIIFENEELVKNIFLSEWNASLNDYSAPSLSEKQLLIQNLKKLLTGNKDRKYIPPNAKRLALFIADNIQILKAKGTDFLIIKSETENPELILSLIIEAANASDKIMRKRYIEFSTNPLIFYKEKLRTARSREHRESLAALISNEEQKLMLASKGKYFTAEPYLKPTVSLYPTNP